MKKILVLIVWVSIRLSASPEIVSGEYIVKMKRRAEVSIASADRAKKLGFSRLLSRRGEIYLIKNNKRTLRDLEKDPEVERVEPNYILKAFFGSRKKKPAPSPYPPFVPVPNRPGTPVEPAKDPLPNPEPDSEVLLPNDPLFNKQWGFRNTQGFDSKIAKAWKSGVTGSDSVVVAVVDSGVDYNHSDLAGNMWSANINGSRVHGYNAINDSNNPMDENNHGTHVAGVIGAVSNNGVGIAGMNWKVQVMAAKFLDSQGSGTTADAIKAIDWAREHGAQIMNMSWGGGGFSQILLEALGRAEAAGVLLVAAAGNESSNNDTNPIYPANYAIPSMIRVAASDAGDHIAWFSNYGANSVDLMAPGVSIFSTIRNDSYASMNGTSMATPFVAGAAALVLSKFPNLSPLELRQKILNAVDVTPLAAGKVSTSGRLNVFKALQ
jgi:subtilisin family serine protease